MSKEVNWDKLADGLSKGWWFRIRILGVKRSKLREETPIDPYSVRRIIEFLFEVTKVKKIRRPRVRDFALKLPFGYWTSDSLFKPEIMKLIESFEKMKASFLLSLRDKETYDRLRLMAPTEYKLSPEEVIKAIDFKILPVQIEIKKTTDYFKEETIKAYKLSIERLFLKIIDSITTILSKSKMGRKARVAGLEKSWTYLRALNVAGYKAELMKILYKAGGCAIDYDKASFPFAELEKLVRNEENKKLKASVKKLLDKARSPISWKRW